MREGMAAPSCAKRDGTSMQYWPLGIYALLALGLVVAMLVASRALGQGHAERATRERYESGIRSTGEPRAHLGIHFYLVAMFFVIFDLEVVFVLAWAVAARQLGWVAFVEIAVFIGVLLAALAYLWKVGALDWGTLARLKRHGPTFREGEP